MLLLNVMAWSLANGSGSALASSVDHQRTVGSYLRVDVDGSSSRADLGLVSFSRGIF